MDIHGTSRSSNSHDSLSQLRLLLWLPIMDGNIFHRRREYVDSFFRELFAAFYSGVVNGSWQVDILPFQSVAGLRHKLNTRSYDAIYLWGCGKVSAGRAFWAFHNEATTEPVWLDANIWVQLVRDSGEGEQVPAMITSFFPETDASLTEDFAEINQFFHRSGLPVVISTGKTNAPSRGLRFSTTLLQNVKSGKTWREAFNAAEKIWTSGDNPEEAATSADSGLRPILLQNERSAWKRADLRQKHPLVINENPVIYFSQSRLPVSGLPDVVPPVMSHEFRDVVYSLEIKKPVHLSGPSELTEAVATILLKNFLQNHPEGLAFWFRAHDQCALEVVATVKSGIAELVDKKLLATAEGITNYVQQLNYLLGQIATERPVVFLFQDWDLSGLASAGKSGSSTTVGKGLEIIRNILGNSRLRCVILSAAETCDIPGAFHFAIERGDFSQFLKMALVHGQADGPALGRTGASTRAAPPLSINELETIFRDCEEDAPAALSVLLYHISQFNNLADFVEGSVRAADESNTHRDQTRPTAVTNLSTLLLHLPAPQQALLSLLSEFRAPVSLQALIAQMDDGTAPKDFADLIHKQLCHLTRLHLVESALNPAVNEHLYSLRPPVLREVNKSKRQMAALPFSPEKAAVYFFRRYRAFPIRPMDLIQAFHYFHLAGNSKMLLKTGREIVANRFAQEEFASAETLLKTMLAAVTAGEDRIGIMLQLGDVYYRTGRLKKAQRLFENLQLIVEKSGRADFKQQLSFYLGKVHLAANSPDVAADQFRYCLELSQSPDMPVSQTEISFYLGRVHSRKGDSGKALKILYLCLEESIRDGRNELTARICREVGGICHQLGLLNQSLQYYAKSLSFNKAAHRLPQYLRDMVEVGKIHLEQKQETRAMHEFHLAARLAESVGDHALNCQILQYLTRIAESRNEYQLAIHYMNQMVQIHQRTGNVAAAAKTLVALAKRLITMRQSDSALTTLQEAVKIFENFPGEPEAAEANFLLGKMYRMCGNHSAAILVLKNCARLAKMQKNTVQTSLAYRELAQILCQQNKYNRAVILLKEGISYSRANGEILGETLLLTDLAKIYRNDGSGDFTSARRLLERARHLCSRLNNPRLAEEIRYSLSEALPLPGISRNIVT